MDEVLQLAQRVLDRATGGDPGKLETYVEHRVVTTVQAGTGGLLRHVGRADIRGVGIRAVAGDRVGYASTADVTDTGLDAVVARARANARASDADPAGAELPAPEGNPTLDGLCLPPLVSMPMGSKVAMATDLANRATSLDSRVRRIDLAQWRDEHRRVAVCSTHGTAAWYEAAFAELWCDALGEDDHGDASDYSYWWGRDPGEADVDFLAAEAVRRTVRLLGQPVTAAGVESVMLDPAIVGLILEMVGRALTGGALGNRRSLFAGRHGQQVAPEWMRLVDDGCCVDAPAGAPFDDEGVQRRRTTLIDDGVLTGALHSCATAASVDGKNSTGNARRSNYKAAPRALPTTLRLEGGSGLPPDHRDAIYLQQVTGSGTGISSVTGRVSLGGLGCLWRDGQVVGRLPTLPVATTLQALLRDVVAVGDDAVVIPDRPVLAPTMLWRPKEALVRDDR